MPRPSLRVPIAAPTPCMPDVQSSDHAQEQLLSAQLRVAASPGSEVGCASLRSSQGGLPKRQSRVRRRPITASVGYSPSRDPSAAWPGQSGGHRTASSFHEYVCSVTPIFLTDSATVLPRPTSTSTSRSIGDDLLGQFFLSAWHGMPSFGFDTTRLSLWKWCRLRGAGHCPTAVKPGIAHAVRLQTIMRAMPRRKRLVMAVMAVVAVVALAKGGAGEPRARMT